ncbi:MAG: 16S rRNA (uracil(1498)-N(3))-methyltransferase [Actinomycetota bacterium]|nr:16S rRNA (uracil(1498)-N(3))-methyltransferase [Actinomycetota bacterium]
MGVPVFLADTGALRADGPLVLTGPEGRHAVTVRRIRPGERVDVTDGEGLVARCSVRATGGDGLVLDVLAREEADPPSPRLVVVQALPKGDRGELAVEAMTEVGVDVVVPWAASRCVTRWRDARGEKSLARWRSAAREAGKQSRRTRFPQMHPLASTDDVVALLAAAALPAVLHEEAQARLAALDPPVSGDVVLVVGPEGGIAPEELAAFAAVGAAAYRLGDTVLRTSTAGVAALAVLLARTGRWG